MADWKILIVILLGLLLITLGLFSEMGMNIGGFGSDITDTISGNMPFRLGGSVNGNMSITGRVYLDELDLKTIPLERIEITYNPEYQKNDIILSDNKVTTQEETKIILEDYMGTFRINGTKLSLSGNSGGAEINEIGLDTIKKLISVKAESIDFENIYLKKIEMNRLEMEKATGNIRLNDKVTVDLSSEPVKIESYVGSVNATEEIIELKGNARRVFVSGDDYSADIIS